MPTQTDYEDLLASIWLHIGWRYITRQLTTPQKELFADAINNYHRRQKDDDGYMVEKWWQDTESHAKMGH